MSDPVTDSISRDAALSPLLDQLSTVVLSSQTVETAFEMVSSLAAHTLPGVAGAGVTLIDERGKRTTSASDDLVRQADEVQYRLDAGPCLTAWRDHVLVRVDDISQDGRWPEWADETLALAVRSVLSTPMMVSGGALGAIKVYSRQSGVFGSEADAVLRLFASQAAVLLANVHSLAESQGHPGPDHRGPGRPGRHRPGQGGVDRPGGGRRDGGLPDARRCLATNQPQAPRRGCRSGRGHRGAKRRQAIASIAGEPTP